MPAADQIDVSVIVPAYRADGTLSRCIESLIAQRFDGRFEVIVVASADSAGELPTLPRYDGLKCVTRVARVPAAVARNIGANLARGRALAFTDADVVAPDGWLARLCSASADRWCVAGAVANGTPASLAGTVEYLVEFFDLTPARTERLEHGATCNLLLPRELWETYGPFPEEMEGCEDTWLTKRLVADDRLRFAPDAVVHHLNRQRMSAVLSHQYALGASHARLAVRQGAANRSPVLAGTTATLGRIRYLYRMLARWTPSELARARLLAPFVIASYVAWGAGLTRESLRIERRRRVATAGPAV